MLKDKFSRHAFSFVTLSTSSACLYFAAQSGSMILLWGCLAAATLAALLVLVTP
jgi:hypothetical protein